MLRFHVEFQEAPAVRTPHLAATWARLEVRIGDRPVTQFWPYGGGSVRPAVYSSAFPLARWAVRNWWYLLHEGLKSPAQVAGARGDDLIVDRSWMNRHGLFLSREGMAYPDLSIYRQGDDIAVRWVPDPASGIGRGRFVGEGFKLLSRMDVQGALSDLIDQVIKQLVGLGVEDDDARELSEEWSETRKAGGEEAELCQRLAMLGMDPYDPDADEAFESAVAGIDMSREVLRDLLDTASSKTLLDGVQLVETLSEQLPNAPPNGGLHLSAPLDPRPYVTGYKRAKRLREEVKQSGDQAPDLQKILKAVGAEQPSWVQVADPSPIVDGVVQLSSTPRLAATARSDRAKRFLVARALHHWCFVPGGASNQRLLSRSNSWEQAASRAFAAELLAPAAAIATRLVDSAWDADQKLADEFDVAPMVIAHQLENHGLG